MNSTNITTILESLNARFGIAGKVNIIAANGGLPAIQITTSAATAEIYLHGAHVTAFQPSASEELIFVSSKTHWEPTKAIRGGIPICFPWFGPKADDPKAPMHGFARTHEWTIASIEEQDEAVQITLTFDGSEATQPLWPHAFHAEYRVSVGTFLQLELAVTNTGDAAFQFEEALHTYHHVGDIHQTHLSGLDGISYLDKVDAYAKKTQSGDIAITGQTDRVYLETNAAITIHDAALSRSIEVEKSSSRNTVVWNPWAEVAASMADMGNDEWPYFVCVEAANCRDNAVTLAPGETHAMGVTIRVANLCE
jgi:glucose-6-phosphate 1-epimerase